MILLKHPWIAFLKTYLAEQVSFYIYLKGLQENDQQKTYWKFGWKYFINLEVGHQYSWSEYISSVNDVARAAGCLLYLLIMSRTSFRANPRSIVAWISRNPFLETGAISEVYVVGMGLDPTTT